MMILLGLVLEQFSRDVCGGEWKSLNAIIKVIN